MKTYRWNGDTVFIQSLIICAEKVLGSRYSVFLPMSCTSCTRPVWPRVDLVMVTKWNYLYILIIELWPVFETLSWYLPKRTENKNENLMRGIGNSAETRNSYTSKRTLSLQLKSLVSMWNPVVLFVTPNPLNKNPWKILRFVGLYI